MAKSTYSFTCNGDNLKTDWWYRTGIYANANRASSVPHRSGVYCIYAHWFNEDIEKLVYIGSAVDLANRVKGHSLMLRVLDSFCDFIEIKFKISNTFLILEGKLISRLKPEYNVAGREIVQGGKSIMVESNV